MSPTRLGKCIVPPTKLVGTLEWRRSRSTILGLDINEERVGIALGTHPSSNNKVQTLEPIPYLSRDRTRLTRRDNKEEVASKLEGIVKEHRVNAFVIGWPLQPDGRYGAPCGKVLHLLDSFAERPKSFITPARPLVLWDERDIPQNKLEESLIARLKDETPTDRWGRSSVFCLKRDQIPESGVFRSTEQFYHKTSKDSTAAALVLKHFMDTHWEPKDDSEVEHYMDMYRDDCDIRGDDIDKYDEDGAYIQPSLL
mmetsp:Transcript_10397/g.14551  ORF Transcript_10397/g.14551 Transcript_10397/m.14551 type:complete len:254 (-) Transcript_10397:290-1051(-)|eukprot:CAMPEP_0185726954 /NCGR_PEP_ID=MMETSP1171-20130828/2781_1 /TAXON_ID=374046 /ORGANISM="Helicotheca tamensis, Strain CCMP826" /LENGTH=253 /DNA_ID=CAMNT_0028395405 /DNA_START=89 /DNA_END=850 /DNA_ORIENTATION=-